MKLDLMIFLLKLSKYPYIFNFFFERKFQLMASALDDNSLSTDRYTNQFLV